jgi:hypothetical protein
MGPSFCEFRSKEKSSPSLRKARIDAERAQVCAMDGVYRGPIKIVSKAKQ